MVFMSLVIDLIGQLNCHIMLLAVDTSKRDWGRRATFWGMETWEWLKTQKTRCGTRKEAMVLLTVETPNHCQH